MKTEVQRLHEFLNIAPPLIRDNTQFTNWLTDTGFFHAPASAKYHGNYAGGLYDHSLRVYQHLERLTSQMENLKWSRPESCFIVGMFHDLCKVDQYVEVEDNPGKTMFGEDEPKGRVAHYERNPDCVLKGHGEKSIILLSQFITLTHEEILSIRYHMGAFETDEWPEFRSAVKASPNVLFTHAADMLASVKDGV